MEKYLYTDLYTLEDSHWWHRAKRNLVVNYLQKITTGKKSKILDIGCGTGKNVEAFAAIGQSYGVDMSEEAVKYCLKRGLKNVKKGSSYDLPFQKNSFEAITLLDVLEHVEEPKTLEEISRVLTKNGHLIITVPAFKWLWSEWDVVLHHKRRYTSSQLSKVLQKHGFAIEKISYVYSFLVIPVFLIRQLKKMLGKKDYGSDFSINNGLSNTILYQFSLLEQKIMEYLPLPFGTSVFCVARKNRD